jgi:aryl-alcohol dehydrogenase-like predicted oxidoreductase
MQPEYNMLSRDIEATLKPACVERNVGIIAYSPLASGALTGKYGRDTTFNDWRAGGKFGVFRPDVWPTVSQRIDRLKQLAADVGVTLTTLAIQWVLRQEGVTGAIVGANTAEQVVANVAALDIAIESEVWQSIDRILDR